jgi:hypothetical protein
MLSARHTLADKLYIQQSGTLCIYFAGGVFYVSQTVFTWVQYPVFWPWDYGGLLSGILVSLQFWRVLPDCSGLSHYEPKINGISLLSGEYNVVTQWEKE